MAAPLSAGMPDAQQLQAGYTLRVTALDAGTGNLVANVNVGKVVLDADIIVDAGGDLGVAYGDWLLVPGPLA